MNRKFRVITLCGSSRFRKDFIEVEKYLTSRGYIVITPSLYEHDGDTKYFYGTNLKETFDEMQKQKIDMADEIMIINIDRYIGPSTREQINYAKSIGKPVHYLEPFIY